RPLDSACLTDTEAAALWAGLARPETLAAAEIHADGCPACRALLAGIGRAPVTVPRADSRNDAPSDRTWAGPALGEAEPRLVAVGRYVLLRRLGAGGMGVVYAAHDEQLARTVAIKLVRPDPTSGGSQATLAARLLREAHALARLSHPSVVPIYDVGAVGERVF